MNDFLQSIRNGSFTKDNGNTAKPRYNNGTNTQRPRRTYEPNGNYMRNNGERKFRPRTGPENFASDDTMTSIKETLQAILANQESALVIAERKAIAEERKADAFEFIARHIGKLTGENFVTKTNQPVTPSKDAETGLMDMLNDMDAAVPEETERVITVRKPESPSDGIGKDDILSIIAAMRREGSTYNEIASHLDSLNLPTFSGRGKWHAQTIHRLCQTV